MSDILHQRCVRADYVESKPHSIQAFKINPTEAGLRHDGQIDTRLGPHSQHGATALLVGL